MRVALKKYHRINIIDNTLKAIDILLTIEWCNNISNLKLDCVITWSASHNRYQLLRGSEIQAVLILHILGELVALTCAQWKCARLVIYLHIDKLPRAHNMPKYRAGRLGRLTNSLDVSGRLFFITSVKIDKEYAYIYLVTKCTFYTSIYISLTNYFRLFTRMGCFSVCNLKSIVHF